MALGRKFEVRELRSRANTFIVIVSIFFFILLARLWYLQIWKGNHYRHFSEENRIVKIWRPAPRGFVFDRNKKVIMNSRPSFDLIITRAYTKNLRETLQYLQTSLNLDFEEEDIDREITRMQQMNLYRQYTFLRDLPWENLAFIETNKFRDILSGVDIDHVKPLRNYVYGPVGAHFFGYLGEIDERKLQAIKANDTENPYKLGDYIGIFGGEKKFERHLRGIDGIDPAEVDARGRIRKESVNKKISFAHLARRPIGGNSITMTIDIDLQKVAYDSFKEGESGSIVAVDPRNGELLAMVNYPSFNPEIFAKRVSNKQWRVLNNDPALPLMDRALRGQYPPGSTFKLILAVAGLEEGKIDTDTTVRCNGTFRLGRRVYRCHKKEGHGIVNIHDAIMKSCDVFFFQLGLKLGIDKIADYAKLFGLGEPTGIVMNNEKSGLIPTSKWKLEAKHEPWQAGETLSSAIGQGFDLATPLQLAYMVATIANRGVLYAPRLLKSIEAPSYQLIKTFPAQGAQKRKISISPRTWNIIHNAMRDVANNPNGTAYWFSRSQITTIAGKTGTSQVVGMKPGERRQQSERRFQDHALYVAFAPFENPEIAVAVVVEHGGHGSSIAAPKARAVIEAYIEKQKKEKQYMQEGQEVYYVK